MVPFDCQLFPFSSFRDFVVWRNSFFVFLASVSLCSSCAVLVLIVSRLTASMNRIENIYFIYFVVLRFRLKTLSHNSNENILVGATPLPQTLHHTHTHTEWEREWERKSTQLSDSDNINNEKCLFERARATLNRTRKKEKKQKIETKKTTNDSNSERIKSTLFNRTFSFVMPYATNCSDWYALCVCVDV